MTQYRAVQNRLELEALSRRQLEARGRALEALSEARLRGLSLSAAAREAGTTVPTVLRYAAPAVERLPSGRYRVMAEDRLYRRLRVVSKDGPVWVDVRGSRSARIASRHAQAIRLYGLREDDAALTALAGKRVGGVVLETDPVALAALAAAGELDAFDLYDSTS